MSSDGIAAQFTSTSEDFKRFDFSCNQCATSSFPVPFGPVINTRASVLATFSMSCFM